MYRLEQVHASVGEHACMDGHREACQPVCITAVVGNTCPSMQREAFFSQGSCYLCINHFVIAVTGTDP